MLSRLLKRRPKRAEHKATHTPYRRPERRERDHRRDRYDWITLGTAVIGVIVVALSTAVTAYQTYLTRAALRETVAQQRAWLTLDVQPGGPMVLQPAGADIFLKIKTTNVGNMPASVAMSHALLIAVPPHPKRPFKRVSEDFQACKSERPDIGVSILPNQTLEFDPLLVEATPKHLAEVIGQDGKVGFLVSACITYKTGRRSSAHQTRAVYYVGDRRRGGAVVLVQPVDAIPVDKVVLSRLAIDDSAE